MLETQIGKTGEVTVEGHVIGRLDGFMFAPDASAAGSEAKALNAAAQKVLAGEIEARATKLSQASSDQIVLANDGALRWTGELVGKLVAGDDTLRPRVRIIADEHLTGPAREVVQNRLDLWIRNHIEKLLAPLFSLSAAEDITGVARGVAFQLVEALGVLERQKVADEVKGLDQPSRATLRKYGVRFGAYHIYLPLLLKPAPRALATQLWALKHEAPDAKGVTELLHLAASGRTSIPLDKDTPKALYRTSGYRICGERAVRVDILERLADLIRPALAWREGMTPKPDGAFDGRGFTITGAMTSLTGASGEDFASILRSLGYRMDRKPKLPDVKPAEAATEAAAETSAEAPATEASAEASAETSSQSLLPDAELMPTPLDVTAGEPVAAAAPEVGGEVADIAAAVEASPPVAGDGMTAPTGDTPAGETPAAEAKTAEPETIEVWRPGGHGGGERRQHHRPRRGQRPPQAGAAAEGAPAPDAAAAASATPGEGGGVRYNEQRREPRQGQGQERNERRQRMERQAKGFGGKPSDNKRDQGRPGEGRDGQGPRGPRRRERDQVDRADRDKYYARPGGSGGRDKAPDPNSPFAKLAALKQQLEGKDS